MEMIFGLFGAGGCAREVMPYAKDQLIKKYSHKYSSISFYYVEKEPSSTKINGEFLISETEFLKLNADFKCFNIGIADSAIRKKLAISLLNKGISSIPLISNESINFGYNSIDEGAIICPNSVISVNVKIGRFFHSNLFSYVAHDCIIGDFVTFAPRVSCLGNVIIEDQVYIGAGACIRNGTKEKPIIIGKDSVIGMGAIVTKNVPPNSVFVGNPAKPLLK